MTFAQHIRTCLAAAFVSAALLTACATPTPYQPDIPGQRVAGGFSEERLAADRYRVTFTGNCFTSRERVEGYLLYRAAELTLEEDYDWFTIIDRLTERDQRTYETRIHDPYWSPAFGYWRPYWRYYGPRYGWRSWYPGYGDPFWADRVSLRTVEQFTAHAEIAMHRGEIPENEERGFDAREVMANLEPTIERPAHEGTC